MDIKAGMRLQINVTFDPKIVKTEYVARCLEEHAKRMLPVMSGKVTHMVFAVCPAKNERPEDLVADNEIRAVGILETGMLFALREVNDIRGLTLSGLIIAREHVQWFKDNEDVLRESFSMNRNHGGTIMVVGGVNHHMEAFL